MNEDKRSTRSNWWLRFVVSLIIAGGFALALSRYIDILPADRSVPGWVLPAYLATLLPYFGLRNLRWWFLVRRLEAPVESGAPSPRLVETTACAFAGMMWIMVLPLRLGELARPLLLNQRTGVSASASLGTVALERVVDGLCACAALFVGLAWLEPSRGEVQTLRFWGLIGAGLLLGVLLALVLVARWPDGIGRVLTLPLAPVPKLRRTFMSLAAGLAAGLRAIDPLRDGLPFVLISVAYWIVNAAGMAVLAVGCGLELEFMQAVTVMGVLALTLLVPGGPAQFGNFQLGVLLGLGLFLSPEPIRARGSVFVFYLYLCQLGTGVALGALAQAWLEVDWRRIFDPLRADANTDGAAT